MQDKLTLFNTTNPYLVTLKYSNILYNSFVGVKYLRNQKEPGFYKFSAGSLKKLKLISTKSLD